MLRITTVPISDLDGFDGVVVTSGNALAALPVVDGLPLLAVGDATAARARAAGFGPVFSAGGDAAALAAAAPKHFPVGARLLFATAEGEGAALAQTLQGTGFAVVRRVAYAVRPAALLPVAARDALVAGQLHAALFMSARTALVFASLLDPGLHRHLVAVDALAIGQQAADQLTPLPWRRVRVSLAPTLDQVLALL
jgi:uroporphyrinogen-III synthase